MTAVAFLYIGGPHQVFHAAPAAAELARRGPEVAVVNFVAGERSAALVERVYAAFEAPAPDIRLIAPPWWGEAAAHVSGRASARKLPMLFAHRRELARFDVIVTAECSSSILRRMGLRDRKMVLIPHGAGDRAVSVEPRMALFDHIIVAGPKNADRMVAEGVVDPADCSALGYLKLDLMRRMRRTSAPLFANGRPTVLYNPHFKRELSSLPIAREIIAAFEAQDRFNLIFAPHIRSFEDADASERAVWQSLAVEGRIIIDLGSDRLLDMSYAIGADIYLGDVSSQVYEFLADLRPCVFIDAHGAAWRDDPSYAFWTLGDVCRPDRIIDTVADAPVRHPHYIDRQRAAVAASFGDSDGAAARAAERILQIAAAKAS